MSAYHYQTKKEYNKLMSNKGKNYRDRHNDERRIVFWLRRHKDKLNRVLKKVG